MFWAILRWNTSSVHSFFIFAETPIYSVKEGDSITFDCFNMSQLIGKFENDTSKYGSGSIVSVDFYNNNGYGTVIIKYFLLGWVFLNDLYFV